MCAWAGTRGIKATSPLTFGCELPLKMPEITLRSAVITLTGGYHASRGSRCLSPLLWVLSCRVQIAGAERVPLTAVPSSLCMDLG